MGSSALCSRECAGKARGGPRPCLAQICRVEYPLRFPCGGSAGDGRSARRASPEFVTVSAAVGVLFDLQRAGVEFQNQALVAWAVEERWPGPGPRGHGLFSFFSFSRAGEMGPVQLGRGEAEASGPSPVA